MEKIIKTSEVLDDLNRGLTRTNKCKGYDPTLGSIQGKYDLTNKEIKYLFSQPALKGKRVKSPVRFTLVDDTPTTESDREVHFLSDSLTLTNYTGFGDEFLGNRPLIPIQVQTGSPSIATTGEIVVEESSQINNNTQQETVTSGNTLEENW